MASISTFLSNIKADLARPSRFLVKFSYPGAEGLTLKCEQAQLPSRTLMTAQQKIYGIYEKYPYETAYNDAEFVFMVSTDMKEKKIFDDWLDSVNPKNTYNVSYKESYQSTITVTQYDLRDRKQYEVQLLNAFPISVNQLDLDWSADGYHKLAVVFAYSEWK